jgi:ferredoxin
MTSSQVTVDRDLCIGSAECVRILPDAFQIDESLGVSVPQPAACSADLELLAEAVRSCPTGALHVLDAHGDAL